MVHVWDMGFECRLVTSYGQQRDRMRGSHGTGLEESYGRRDSDERRFLSFALDIHYPRGTNGDRQGQTHSKGALVI